MCVAHLAATLVPRVPLVWVRVEPDYNPGHVALEVHDGIRFGLGAQHEIRDGLAERIAAMPRAARVALELWCADLWRSHEDDELWEREIAWLAGEAAS